MAALIAAIVVSRQGLPGCTIRPYPMEFLNLVIVFATALLLWRKPGKERLAFRLLVVSIVLMIFLFELGTRTSILPGLNY